MININKVYQRVLAFANKEQRGYITPQEFNLLSNKAQMDIFESYFHDLKMAHVKPKNNTNFADEIEIIEEKLHSFYVQSGVFVSLLGNMELPPEMYRVKNVLNPDKKIVEQISEKEFYYISNNPLTKPTKDRPVYVRQNALADSPFGVFSGSTTAFIISPPNDDESQFYTITYWRKPADPKWGYVVFQDKALYNANTTINFELHPSEEEALVTRILFLSGITIVKPDVIEVAMTDNAQTKQEQNN